MNQITLGLDPVSKKTRKEVFLDEMNQVVPWSVLVGLIQPHARGAHRAWCGRPPFAVETMLRIHCLQLCLMLKTGTVVDASMISAPSSTQNQTGKRDPEMHQTKKSKQWHHGTKLNIGVDAELRQVHTVIGTEANVNDVTQGSALLHGEETEVWGDAGYQGLDKREESQGKNVRVNIALRPGKRKTLDPKRELHQLLEKAEKLKASIRAKVEHAFRLIKQQFGYAKVRYRGG